MRVLLIAAVLCAGIVVAAQSPTFSTRLEVVRLDVLVTDGGKPVKNLTRDDFAVFDNGVAQVVDLVSADALPLSVVLALDASSSVRGERLDHLRDAGGAVLDGFRAGDEAALITFSEAVSQNAALTSEVVRVRDALAAVAPSGDTALTDGAYVAITIADGAAGRGMVIIFSDGRDTASWLSERAVTDAARRSNAVVYAVSSGARDTSFLRELTDVTGGRHYELESTRNLRSVFVTALEEFRQRYLVSYTPRGVEKGGWHKVEVRVKRRGVTVRARPGYLGGP